MILKIYDQIVNADTQECLLFWGERAGVSITDIDKFIADIPAGDNNIDLYIHSAGGDVIEGWAIVDKLRSTGKVISATVDGLCASMATVILLAASVRRAQPHATLHIHKPYYPPYTLPDAYDEDDLTRMANDLKMDTERILNWYVERTGADRETLAAIMDEDRDMSADEALSLGFVQEICTPASASTSAAARKGWPAKENAKPLAKTDMAEQKKNEGKGILTALASFLGLKVDVQDENGEDPKTVITTADDRTLTVHIPEGQEPVVGDAAEPDGEFPLEDGRTIKVENGAIVEIVPAEQDGEEGNEGNEENEGSQDNTGTDDEIEAIKAENERLKAENEELAARVAELEQELADAQAQEPSADDKAIVSIVNKCGGAEWLDRMARSNYVPAQRKNAKTGTTGYESSTAARLAELKAKRNL